MSAALRSGSGGNDIADHSPVVSKAYMSVRFMRGVELTRSMDIATYLEQQKAELGKQTKQVRDFSVFDFSYIPEQPVVRDECKELIDEMLRFDLSSIGTHMAVIGSRGSGKTLRTQIIWAS